jgi:hypothetical protein
MHGNSHCQIKTKVTTKKEYVKPYAGIEGYRKFLTLSLMGTINENGSESTA